MVGGYQEFKGSVVGGRWYLEELVGPSDALAVAQRDQGVHLQREGQGGGIHESGDEGGDRGPGRRHMSRGRERAGGP